MIKPEWAAERDFGVFINCPFDDDYRDQRDAIVFTSIQAGFVPWMAGSTGDVAASRVERIYDGLRACRYSVHDLTRYQGEGQANLSRFNMPLELGMAMAVRHASGDDDRHDWMFMVPEGHVYQRYISDLSGFDPIPHDGTARRVAVAVLSWLSTRAAAQAAVGPAEVLGNLPEYSRRKLELDADWESRPPWRRVIELAVEVARG